MKIAIHHRKGSFSEYWIKYCRENGINYKLVDAYASNIIKQVEDCDAFMWHYHHSNYKDALFAKQLLFSLQQSGKKVFPDFNTTWHFDDKLGQKYLLESIGAPLVPSYVFYTKEEALNWINETTFPKVFKLRSGAGATNVKLVKSKKQAIKLINKAFRQGFSQLDRWGNLKERYRKYKSGKDNLWGVCKGIGRLIIPNDYVKMHSKEKGYIYFQDFIPNNDFDVRLIIIGGDKAFGMSRLVRKNDFRASGSSNFRYDVIDDATLRIAFDVVKQLKLQVIAFDFIYDHKKNPLIVEMSYGFGTTGSGKAKGYWTKDLNWHEGSGFNFYGWMVEQVM